MICHSELVSESRKTNMTEQIQHIDQKLFEILETVSDPEIPVLSIMEMGVVRSAKNENGIVHVQITPTYSGCPAMDVIGDDIKKAFREKGLVAKIELVLSPSETADKEALLGNKKLVKCPQCGSLNTKLVSQFGSTACKAFFQCEECLEPFDYFKCLK